MSYSHSAVNKTNAKKNEVSKGHPAAPSNYEAANADQQYSFFK